MGKVQRHDHKTHSVPAGSVVHGTLHERFRFAGTTRADKRFVGMWDTTMRNQIRAFEVELEATTDEGRRAQLKKMISGKELNLRVFF